MNERFTDSRKIAHHGEVQRATTWIECPENLPNIPVVSVKAQGNQDQASMILEKFQSQDENNREVVFYTSGRNATLGALRKIYRTQRDLRNHGLPDNTDAKFYLTRTLDRKVAVIVRLEITLDNN